MKNSQIIAELKALPTHAETIRCPNCESIQCAEILHTFPWHSYVHNCTSCGYVIMESEWEPVGA